MISYRDGAEGLVAAELASFFQGWPVPPSVDRRLACLTGAQRVMLAFDGDELVGFVTALTDGVLTASIPLLEVLPSHRRRGIGSELVRRVLGSLGPMYGVDVCCDTDLVPFYERLGFAPVEGLVRREPRVLP